MSSIFKIGGRAINNPLNPYVIAEIGVNHGGDLVLAKKMIDDVVDAGGHAAKFQSYKANKIASKNSPAYWDTKKESTQSQYELFKKYDSFEPNDYAELALYCKQKGLDFLSTPFDLDAVDYLDPLMPAFKIASADITNVPLLRKVGGKGKPVILSTGASTLPEIEFAVSVLKLSGAEQVALLHCVLNYPTSLENAQLGMIKSLKRVFPECVVGYSDHVVPDSTISALSCAAMLGACILEKHFTYDKSLPGNDHYHAMDKNDLKCFVKSLDKYRCMIGSDVNKTLELEKPARLHARRSIVATIDIKAGEVLTENHLIAKRPGHGISPVLWDDLIGRVARVDIAEDTLINWEMLV